MRFTFSDLEYLFFNFFKSKIVKVINCIFTFILKPKMKKSKGNRCLQKEFTLELLIYIFPLNMFVVRMYISAKNIKEANKKARTILC